MQELIRVSQNEKNEQVVSAKELYLFLGFDKSNWSSWAKKNIEQNDFVIENQDWEGFVVNTNGNDTKDYSLTLDFAKRLAMMARTQKGEDIRSYFIECENKIIKPKELSRKEILLLALEAEERAILAETQVLEMQPKADFYDTVTDSKDAIDLGSTAKVLKLRYGRTTLFKNLRDLGVLMKNNQPYQEKLDKEWFIVVESSWSKPNGDSHIYLKTLVLQKGLDGIRKLLTKNNLL